MERRRVVRLVPGRRSGAPSRRRVGEGGQEARPWTGPASEPPYPRLVALEGADEQFVHPVGAETPGDVGVGVIGVERREKWSTLVVNPAASTQPGPLGGRPRDPVRWSPRRRRHRSAAGPPRPAHVEPSDGPYTHTSAPRPATGVPAPAPSAASPQVFPQLGEVGARLRPREMTGRRCCRTGRERRGRSASRHRPGVLTDGGCGKGSLGRSEHRCDTFAIGLFLLLRMIRANWVRSQAPSRSR